MSTSSFLLFALFSLQGAPCALIDSYLPQVIQSQQLGLHLIGLAYLVYLPFNFRFLYAIILDRFQKHHPPRRALIILLSIACMTLMLAAAFPVSVFSADHERTAENLPRVYALLAIVMLVIAVSDPAMDAILLKSSDTEADENEEGAASNSMQTIAFKAGKWCSGLVCSLLLSTFAVGWTSSLLIIAASFAAVIFTLHRQEKTEEAAAAIKQAASSHSSHLRHHRSEVEEENKNSINASEKELKEVNDSTWMIITRCITVFTSVSGFSLLALALTNKLGEVLTRQMLTPFQMDEATRAINITSLTGLDSQSILSLDARTRELRITQIVADISNETSIVSLLGSIVPILFAVLLPAKWKLADRGMHGLMLFISAVRCMALVTMSFLTPAVPLLLYSSSTAALVQNTVWRFVSNIFALCIGASTSLMYIVALASVRKIASFNPKAATVMLTLYSLVECSDDFARMIGNTLSGYVLNHLQGQFHQLFLLSAWICLVPVVSHLVLFVSMYYQRNKHNVKLNKKRK